MFQANVPEKIIQKTTGHRSIEALRSYERVSNEQQKAVMKNAKLNEEQQKKWLSVVTNDMMSSEDSGPDVVHPIPWRK